MEGSSSHLHQLRHPDNRVAVGISVRNAVDAEEHKVHSHHAHSSPPTMLQKLRSRLHFGGAVSLPVCLALCFLCLWAGSAVNMGSVVPTPSNAGGPGEVHSKAHSSRSLLLLSNEAAKQLKADALAKADAVVVKSAPINTHPIITDVDIEQFEEVALTKSGFSTVRPAIGHGESGESIMRVVPFQVISHYPRITYFPGFLTTQQAEHVIALAKTFMTPSSLAYRPGESIPETQEVRTSSGCFLAASQDKDGILSDIEEKIAAVTHLPVEHGEPFNVLRYDNQQHYDSHYDAFDPKSYGKRPTQRIATLLTFLQAPEEGGETIFKREGMNNGNLTINDWRTCADGLGIKVAPKTGDAVLFWSVTPDLELDQHSLHGACPVVRGQKWSMAKWIHEKPLTRPHVPRH